MKSSIFCLVIIFTSFYTFSQDQIISNGYSGSLTINGTVIVQANASINITSLTVTSGSLIILQGAKVFIPEGDFPGGVFNATLVMKPGSGLDFARANVVMNGVDSIGSGAVLGGNSLTFNAAGNFNEGTISVLQVTFNNTMTFVPCSVLVTDEIINNIPNSISGSGFLSIGFAPTASTNAGSYPVTTSSNIIVNCPTASPEFGAATVSATATNPCAGLADSIVYFRSTEINGMVTFNWETDIEVNANHFEIVQVVDTGLKYIASVASQSTYGFSNGPLVYNYQTTSSALILGGFQIFGLILFLGLLFGIVARRFGHRLALLALITATSFISCSKSKPNIPKDGVYELREVHNDGTFKYSAPITVNY